MTRQRIGWYIKQLVPLRYVSTYSSDNTRRRVTWRMWLGHCYNIRETR